MDNAAAEPADINVDLVQLLSSSRNETSRPAKNLKKIVVAAATQIAAVDHAGITAVPHRGVIRSLASSDGHVLVADNIQQRCLQGPCFELPRQHRICRMDDTATESRWPLFTHELLSRTPIRSMLSIQLFGHAEGGAALNLYADHANAFNDEAEEASLAFAAHAALAMELGRQQAALRGAPLERDVIGQATGVLMERFNMDGQAALALLVQLSEKYHEMLPLVARRVLVTFTSGRPVA
ncbi:MAG: ANTAR domain-containing protein [Mycobacterium sp.]|nr:ANTAR domain-containing protein [Mycobacterium sp.]